MNLEHEILRLKALLAVQSADVSSLVAVVRICRLASSLDHQEQPPAQLDTDELFLRGRRKHLHAMLEHLEDRNPAFAAQLQAEIDRSSKLFPFVYENEEPGEPDTTTNAG
jgi:hypothetical protein